MAEIDEIKKEQTGDAKSAAPEKKAAEEKPVEKSVEDKLQDALVEIAKLKKSFDKAASEASDYKKKYNATLSEQEQANIAKAEAEAEKDERLKALERKDRVHDLTENFMDLGYSKEQAKQAAEAQYDGDTETLFKIQKQVQDAQLKSKEAEWLASRPEINAGKGSSEEQDSFIKGFNSVPTRFGK